MPTITTTIINGITIGRSGAYASPLTIAPAGAVDVTNGTAVYGPGALGAATIVNAGTVAATATSGIGIDLQAGGYVDNFGGLIAGYRYAVYMAGVAAGTVTNSGRITGGGRLSSFGRFIGGDGVKLGAGGTIANSGTIVGSVGVMLAAGGSVGNTGGLISGNGGIYITGAAGTVTNSGTVEGGYKPPNPHLAATGDGVQLAAGGIVDNVGGLIGGAPGIAITGGAGTVTNSGTIAGSSFAVTLAAGGTVDNYAGLIEGYVSIGASAGTVTNSGTIQSYAIYGRAVLDLGAGGSIGNAGLIKTVDNGGGARIEGGAGTITNSGTIIGSGGGDGVLLGAGGSVLNTGAGLIEGPAAVYINGSGGTVTNFGTIIGTVNLKSGGGIVDNAGLIDGSQGVDVTGSATVVNSGVIAGGNYGVELAASGSIRASGGLITNSGTIAGVRGVVIGNVGVPSDTIVNFGAISGSSGTAVVFGGGGGDTLVIEPGSALSGALAGFRSLDAIDLVGVNAATASLVYSETTGTLTVLSGGTTVASLAISGNFVTNDFTLSSDSYGGTDITVVGQVSIGPTFSGAYTGGIVLNNPTTQNPATLAAGGFVTNTYGGDAVYGTGAAAWDFTNLGTIEATGRASTGLALAAGGTVSNAAGALIAGAVDGVQITGATGSVTNYGTINATGTASTGLALSAGGTVSNAYGALIAGAVDGVYITGAAGSVTNYGTIQGTSVGIYARMGGTMANSGFIEGEEGSVSIVGAAGTLTNYGTIIGGVSLDDGGVANNLGLIEGTGGLGVFPGGTITNSGTIIGTTGNGLGLGVGNVVNSGTIRGAAIGALLTMGSVANTGIVEGVVALDIVGGAGTVSNSGAIVGTGGYGINLFNGGTVVDAGTIGGGRGIAVNFVGTGGNLLALEGGYSLGGSVVVAGTANTLELLGSAGPVTVDFDKAGAGFTRFGTIAFGAASGNSETLTIGNTTGTVGTISGFTSPLEIVDLTGLAGGTIGNGGALNGSDQLVVGNGTQSAMLQLDTSTDYTGVTWQTSPDGSGGTDVAPVCFCRGTRILTDRGEVAVEALAVGDRVQTLSGAFKPIRWIGVGRDLVTRRNRLARPIIVRRDALADGVPRRDLALTHGHALYFDGVLIPVENLINYRSILWDESARVVEYYHIELADHDVIFAEGTPAETYYDAGNRAFFQNTREGSEAGADKPTCAPVLTGGKIVEKVWAELFERAGGHLERNMTDDPDVHLLVDGERLDPTATDGGVYSFAVDRAPTAMLHLCSRSGVLSLLGIDRSDHRLLGVPIQQIILWHAGIPTSFDHDAPQLREGGCHPAEDGYCWTDGELALPARFFTLLNGAFTLAVHTKRHRMRYPIAALTRAA